MGVIHSSPPSFQSVETLNLSYSDAGTLVSMRVESDPGTQENVKVPASRESAGSIPYWLRNTVSMVALELELTRTIPWRRRPLFARYFTETLPFPLPVLSPSMVAQEAVSYPRVAFHAPLDVTAMSLVPASELMVTVVDLP